VMRRVRAVCGAGVPRALDDGCWSGWRVRRPRDRAGECAAQERALAEDQVVSAVGEKRVLELVLTATVTQADAQ
jgi:hypothetical protein